MISRGVNLELSDLDDGCRSSCSSPALESCATRCPSDASSSQEDSGDECVEEFFESSFEVLDEKPLAVGSFASVWRCRSRADGQLRAAKRLHTALLLPDERRALAFSGELTLQAELRHPHVVELHGVVQEPQHITLVLELCAGGDLQQWLQSRGPASGLQAATVARHMLRALCYLHAQDVVHRDVKCENLFLADVVEDLAEGSVKLGDLGSAARLDESGYLTQRVGSPPYMAPEILEREPYNASADLYSAGVVLQMLFGQEDTPLPGLLDEDPDCRPSAVEALAGSWLQEGDAEANVARSRGWRFWAGFCGRRRHC